MSMIGKTLGTFECTSLLGKGGMGEVYKAKDLKLGRDVAIKVLPEEFAKDSDRVARFQREAKLLASLNHPNIASIYGLEESGGTSFLVLELVEGETLADRLQRGPIPVEESLKLALQIAEALEAAHEKGVIHRDLKTANIKVTTEGRVKVLDFGLAKAFAGEQADLNLSNSPTLSNMATQQGIILGTAAYMSPEQARGIPVDKRADIWAFGCVLFEMLTGQQTWTGATVTDIIAAALAKDPDFSSLPPNIHPRIRELLGHCLQKDPTERFRDVGDVRTEIKRILADPKGVLIQPLATVQPRRRIKLGLSWVVTIAILSLVVAGVAVWKLKPVEPRQVVRFYYDLPKDQQFNALTLGMLSVSADGKQFVYSTSGGLYLRSVDEPDAKLVIGTETNPSNPFFSPDGKWIGYYSQADGKLKKIAISGGAPVALCDANFLVGASWGTDDTIVYGEVGKGIMRVSSNGGTPEIIVKLTGLYLVNPQILPDNKTLLFAQVTADKSQIVVQSLKSDERKVLVEGDTAHYLPTGHLVYMVHNNLSAIPFDLSKLEVTSGPVPLVDGVFRRADTNAPQFAVSNSGTLVYIPGTAGAVASPQRTLVWVNRKGKEEPISAAPNDYLSPRISPDGTKVALSVNAAGKYDIWIWDIARETMTRLTFNEASTFPLWTPDGRRIAFLSGGGNKPGVYWRSADGTGEDERLGSGSEGQLMPWSWSKDGKTLVLAEFATGGGGLFDIGAISMEGDHKLRPLLQEKYVEVQPKISPDGRWMAYASNESGKGEVYVRPFPEINRGRWQVSTNGGDSPLWSRDGRELFYRYADSVMAVAVQTEPTFNAGKPQVLFRGTYVRSNLPELCPWDISSDGKRFLMMKEPAPAGQTDVGPRRINIVLNWLEELKQRVPVP